MNSDSIESEANQTKQPIDLTQQTEKPTSQLQNAKQLGVLAQSTENQKLKQCINNQKIEEQQKQLLPLAQSREILKSQSLSKQGQQQQNVNFAQNIGKISFQRIKKSEQLHNNLQKKAQTQAQANNSKEMEDSGNPFLQQSITQIILQTQLKEEQAVKIEDSSKFFMSIRSQQSEVTLLDEESQKMTKNNEVDRVQNDFTLESEELKIFVLKNGENQGRSSSQESEINQNKNRQTKIQVRQAQQSQSTEIVGFESKELKQMSVFQPVFISAQTQQLKVQQNNQEKQTNVNQSVVEFSSGNLQKKLNYVSCNINLAIDKQNLLIQKEQTCISTTQKPKMSQEQAKKLQSQQKTNQKTEPHSEAKPQIKVQPLDIKTLSVLTLSCPEGIKSIKPPSPKAQGRSVKPWEKLKKLKSNTTSLINPLSTDQNNSSLTQSKHSLIPLTTSQISQIIEKKQQEPLDVLKNQNSQGLKQEKTATKLISLQNAGETSMQVELKTTNSQIMKPEQSFQQLKKSYSYLTSVIDPKSANSQITSTEKREQQYIQASNQLALQQNPIFSGQTEKNDELIYEQANNHPLLRNYPIRYQTFSKEEALVDDLQINNQQLNQDNNQQLNQDNNQQFNQEKQQPQPQPQKQIVQDVAQNPQNDDEKKPELPQNNLNQKLSSKKSVGSEIINDSSFQAKNSQKSVQLKKRLQQLELQIQRQKKINKELEVTSTFERRLLLSLLTGLAAGGVSLLLRKDKLGSMLLALATGVSTFILKK